MSKVIIDSEILESMTTDEANSLRKELTRLRYILLERDKTLEKEMKTLKNEVSWLKRELKVNDETIDMLIIERDEAIGKLRKLENEDS